MQSTRIILAVLISRRRLDRELASGRDHRATKLLAVRAGELTDPATCRWLAGSLRRVVSGAGRRDALRRITAPRPLRGEVMACREALLGIADRLERPGSLNVCGVARVRLLITDSGGPLYSRRAERSLIEAIWWIADGFQPCPPHDWRSPVVMKLDPEHIAWTCARCGAIATSEDPAVRPA